MANKQTTLNEIGETLAFIVENMATKDDVRAIIKDTVPGIIHDIVPGIIHDIVPGIIDEKLQPIVDELVSIRRDLAALKKRAEESAGLTKEIDHAFERIGAIEKHLGLKTVSAETS